jgi:hypothetical protein
MIAGYSGKFLKMVLGNFWIGFKYVVDKVYAIEKKKVGTHKLGKCMP